MVLSSGSMQKWQSMALPPQWVQAAGDTTTFLCRPQWLRQSYGIMTLALSAIQTLLRSFIHSFDNNTLGWF